MIGSTLPRRPRRPTAWLLLGLAGALVTQTGCVTSKKYRLAKAHTPPPKILNWNAVTPPIELTLQTVNIFKGPGSWKREARWDEYVVQLANHGEQPATVDSAALTDLQGNPQFPGSDPWVLEKLSYTNWDKYGKAGLTLVAGAGAIVVMGAMVEGAAYGSIMAGGTTTGAVAFLNLVPVIAVVDITVVAFMNHNNKGKVQEEFKRRRLTLPRTLRPGETVAGSLFFPMTPGPRRLTLTGKSGETPFELVLELKPLATLHLKPAAGK